MGTCSGSFPGSKVGRFETGRENNCLPCKRHLTKFQQGFPIQSFPIRNLKPRLVPRPTIISSDWRGETKTPAAPLPPFGKLRSISIFISQFKILFCFAYYTFKPTGVSIVFRGRELYYHCFFGEKKLSCFTAITVCCTTFLSDIMAALLPPLSTDVPPGCTAVRCRWIGLFGI